MGVFVAFSRAQCERRWCLLGPEKTVMDQNDSGSSPGTWGQGRSWLLIQIQQQQVETGAQPRLGPCAFYAEKQRVFVSLRMKLGHKEAVDPVPDRKGPPASALSAHCSAQGDPGGWFPQRSSFLQLRDQTVDPTGSKEFKQSQKQREKHVFHPMWNTVLIKLVSFFSY